MATTRCRAAMAGGRSKLIAQIQFHRNVEFDLNLSGFRVRAVAPERCGGLFYFGFPLLLGRK